ncbi:MAG: hypothetical protein HY821_04865 [Acidobacteria bacterium]|nr:hypothetical protein [Acidobacteriota bacterium]
MIEILTHGIIESDEQLLELAAGSSRIVIPDCHEEVELTHWWVIREEGREALYAGTPETFATYVGERNGGLQ